MHADGGSGEGRSEAVELSVEVAARPATVWRCVTQADLLSRWLAAAVTIDPRVGGAVRINFARHATVVEGVVEELRENASLVFTWGVASGPQEATMPVGSTRVRIALAEIAGGTRVTLRHEGLPTAKERSDHAMGWTGYLGSLAGIAPLAAVEGSVEALCDAWLAAWEQTDAAQRDATLARCTTDDVSLRDVHTDGRGRAWLSQWIAMCQQMFAGVRMVREGDVLHARGSLVFRWRAEGPGGTALGRGINHARLSLDGRIAAVEGFWER